MANILLFDRNPINRRFLWQLLQAHGHSVAQSGDAEQASKLARLEPPDLMMVDMAAADVEGCRFAVELRCDPQLAQPRLLICALASVEPEARALAHAMGASFVVKPTDSALLLARVEDCLSEAAPQSAPATPDDTRSERMLRAIAKLVRRNAEQGAKLEVARNALELEIKKRISAEQDLMNVNCQLQEQAMRDPVTGLYNRRFLEASLLREESRAKRIGRTLAVMMIDVDHFKEFNDTLGHTVGDTILRSVGECMQSVSRGDDVVARYGGDEFVLMMANATPEVVCRRAQLISERARSLTIGINGQELGPITLSVGIAMFPDDGGSTQTVLQVADEALLRSKQAGRDRISMGKTIAA
ncbi:MAG TPA: diguanylate cyclase [Steroidobacteraceae bacterium]|nr:diguanylate cyclase [Steroidobacteraceae bacterium]